MEKFNDPKIKIADAVAAFGGNKSALARYLGLNKVTVTDWTNDSDLEYIPGIHAYRLRDHHPDFKK
jgi:hypothetical protein